MPEAKTRPANSVIDGADQYWTVDASGAFVLTPHSMLASALLGTSAISTVMLADGSVTAAKLAAGVIPNGFATIAIAGQSSVVADSAADTLTLAAGTGISLTTNAATDTITITASAALPDGDKGDITVSGGGSVFTVDAGAINSAKLGQDITTQGKSLLTSVTRAEQRTAMGLGSAAIQPSTAFAAAEHTQTASTITDLNTAIDARITAGPVFTSAAKGLAPQSPGGTTAFLRADGTWTAPPAGSVSGGDGGLDWFDIRDAAYGGNGNGTASNSTAAQAALNAAAVNGGTVHFSFRADGSNRFGLAPVSGSGSSVTLPTVNKPIRIFVDKGVSLGKLAGNNGRILDFGDSTVTSRTVPDVLDLEMCGGGNIFGLNTRNAETIGAGGGEDPNDNGIAIKSGLNFKIHGLTFENWGNGLLRPATVGEGALWDASGLTPTYISTTQFTVPGDHDGNPGLEAGKTIRLLQTSSNLVAGRVVSAVWDSGSNITTVTFLPLNVDGTTPTAYNTLEFFKVSDGAFMGYGKVFNCTFRNVVQVITTNDSGSQAIHFYENTLDKCSYVKITSKGRKNDYHVIERNLIKNSMGIWLQSCSYVRVRGNTLIDCAQLSSVKNAILVHYNDEAVDFEDMVGNEVTGNTLVGSGAICAIGKTDGRKHRQLLIARNRIFLPGACRFNAPITASGGHYAGLTIRDNEVHDLQSTHTGGGIRVAPICLAGDTHKEELDISRNKVYGAGPAFNVARDGGSSRDISGLTMEGNLARTTGTTAIQDVERATIRHNDLEVGSFTPCELLNGSRMHENRIVATAVGLSIASTSTGFELGNNQITGGTSSLAIASAAANWRIFGESSYSPSASINYTGCTNWKAATVNPGAMSDGARTEIIIAFAGAAPGRRPEVYPGVDLQGLEMGVPYCRTDEVRFVLTNRTGAPVTLASATWHVNLVNRS